MEGKQELMYNTQMEKVIFKNNNIKQTKQTNKQTKTKNAHRVTGVAVPSVQNEFLKATASFKYRNQKHVTAVAGRASGGGVDADVTAVAGRAGGGAGGGAVVTPVQGRVGDAAGGGVDVIAVAGRDGGGADVTAVGGRTGGDAGAAVSSEVDVVVIGTALVVEVEVVGCAPMDQCHGPTGYSRRGSVAGVDAFRVFCCRQRRRRDRGLVPGCGRVCRCE